MPPPGKVLASNGPGGNRTAERTGVDPLHAIGICIVAANAETVTSGYVAAVEASDVASRMEIITAHSRVCDDCM